MVDGHKYDTGEKVEIGDVVEVSNIEKNREVGKEYRSAWIGKVGVVTGKDRGCGNIFVDFFDKDFSPPKIMYNYTYYAGRFKLLHRKNSCPLNRKV